MDSPPQSILIMNKDQFNLLYFFTSYFDSTGSFHPILTEQFDSLLNYRY